MTAKSILSAILHPVKADAGRFALIVSGDGMKTTLTTALTRRLAQAGFKAARMKAITYFWEARSPDIMAHDLERHLNHHLKNHPDDRFLLIGYSFGAGTLPFAINRFSKDLRARIDGAVLLAPPKKSDFKFFFRSWFNKSTRHALDTAPEILRLSEKMPVLYLRGEDDFVGPSSELKPSEMLTIKHLSGGHDFAKEYDALAKIILEAFP